MLRRRSIEKKAVVIATVKDAELVKKLVDDKDYKGIIVFATGIDWDIALFQRPHQLAQAFSRDGYLVFYCSGNLSDKITSMRKLSERLYLTKDISLFYHLKDVNLFCYWSVQNEYISKFEHKPKVIYDFIDDLSIFALPKEKLIAGHDWLIKHADVVSCSAENLYKEVKKKRKVKPVLLVPNGVEYVYFHDSNQPKPLDLRKVAKHSKVVGYYGALAKWFDYPLLIRMCKAFPNVCFVLIGLIYDDAYQSFKLNGVQNLFYLGIKDYKSLPGYAKSFDVAIIPFLINTITLSTSPIKMYEYLAAGAPVLTTDMPECKKLESVETAENHEEFIKKLSRILSEKHDPLLGYKEAIEGDWMFRARTILAGLK
jgi:glycosyltransferase involved in cell wall biosynthesis